MKPMPTLSKPPIWVYWEDPPGSRRPQYLDLTFRTIERHADGMDVRFVDRTSIEKWLPHLRADVDSVPSIASKTDYFRALLLLNYGGIWIDIDTIVFQPLTRISDLLETSPMVTCGARFGALQNGFVAARQGAESVQQWVAEMDKRLDERGPEAMRWGDLGSYALLPILDANPGAAFDIPPSMSAPVPWRQWKKFFSRVIDPQSVIGRDPYVIALFNNVMEDRLRSFDNARLLGGPWLLSALLRIALGVTSADEERLRFPGLATAGEAWWRSRVRVQALASRVGL